MLQTILSIISHYIFLLFEILIDGKLGRFSWHYPLTEDRDYLSFFN